MNAIFRQNICFFQLFFVLQHYIQHKVTFLWVNKCAMFNKMHQREYKVDETDIFRRMAVSLLTNQLQQETFIERKLRSVSVVNVLMIYI